MFKMYDLNMKEIPFPDGLIPLDIFVSSISKKRATEEIEGRNGVIDYGTNYGDRTVELTLFMKPNDRTDYRLLRNELYALFDSSEYFYVAEKTVPSRVLKVVVDESFIPDRPITAANYAEVTINCRTLDSVFWETKYTTLELHDSGYSSAVEKYGLVDNIDDEKVKYRFTPTKTDTKLYNIPFQHGFIGADGKVIQEGTGSYTLNVGYFDLVEGMTYEFRDLGENEKVLYWWLYFYDENEEFVERIPLNQFRNGKDYTFTANSPKMKIMLNPKYPIESYKVGLDEVGVDVLPTLIHNSNTHRFVVHNAGNVTVQPESMMLNIHARFVRSDNNFTIRNITTGEEVILKRESKGSHFRIQGMVISLGSITNIFRDTNRRFISLVPGDNQFEILNGTFEEIRFEFKYLYK